MKINKKKETDLDKIIKLSKKLFFNKSNIDVVYEEDEISNLEDTKIEINDLVKTFDNKIEFNGLKSIGLKRF